MLDLKQDARDLGHKPERGVVADVGRQMTTFYRKLGLYRNKVQQQIDQSITYRDDLIEACKYMNE